MAQRPLRIAAALLATFGAAAALGSPAFGAAFNVTRTDDPASGTCTPASCSLRQAFDAAAGASGTDNVVVPGGTYTLALGHLVVQDPVILDGAGRDSTFIDGNHNSQVIEVTSSGSLTASGVTIQHGRLATGDSSIAKGAGIFSAGTLALTDAAVTANEIAVGKSSIAEGSGIYSDSGSVMLTRTVVNSNHMTTGDSSIGEGAGIFAVGSLVAAGSLFDANRIESGAQSLVNGAGIIKINDTLSVQDTTIRANTAAAGDQSASEGAGLFATHAAVTLARNLVTTNAATVGDNASADGGGIAITSEGSASLTNVTITGNSALAGANSSATAGGLQHSGKTLPVVNSTIASNSVSATSGTARGGDVEDHESGSATQFANSIVSAGATPAGVDDCYTANGGATTSAGHNLESSDQCGFHAGGDLVNRDPLLGPLADNGGPTQTLALTAGSPGIDAGDNASCPAVDQRGVVRPQGPLCDIGAFEVQVVPPNVPLAPGDHSAPRFRSARLSPSTFAVDAHGTREVAMSARTHVKLGTTLRYSLSEPARVVVTIQKRAGGRRVGKHCRKQTRANRKRHHCTRFARAGRFAIASAAGANSHKFSGRIGRRSLKPARYRAVLVAVDAAGNRSTPKRLSFRIVRRASA